MKEETKVLIIGAGPTGLMMAAQLALRNIPFRIIDKTEDHTTQSRALVVHARSMEIFQQMGIASKAIELGQIAKAANLFVNGKKIFRFDISNIGRNLTAFPFALMLEQSQTETLLNDFIENYGHKVERNTELLDFSISDGTITATIRNSEGRDEIMKIQWIIGSDGTHSKVREKLNIPFEGKTYEQSLYVLDCQTNIELPNNEVAINFTEKDFTGFFPLTNGRYRVLGTIPEKYEHKNEITFEDVSEDFSNRIKMNVALSNPYWISKYRSHHRLVTTFRKGRCFVAGDAAHIHSPIGAQGMNTGLQDAYNLGWKLALVIQGIANEKLLDTYHEERVIVARTLVRTTDRAFNYVNTQHIFIKTFRMYIMPSLLRLFMPMIQKSTLIRKFMFSKLSEIGIHYRKSKLSKENLPILFKKNAPKAGDRFPFLPTSEMSQGTEKLVQGTQFHLVIFSRQELADNKKIAIQNLIKEYNKLIELHDLSYNHKTEHMYKFLGIEEEGCFIIRPDSYIGYRGSTIEAKKIENYFLEIFNK